MAIYIITIILSVLFTYIAISYKNKYKKYNYKNYKKIYIIFAFFAFLIPCIVSGFRAYTVGTDTSGTYWQLYNASKEFSVYTKIRDVGYAAINRLVYILIDNYTGVLMLNSLIMCGCCFYSIFRISDNPTFSTYLFFATNMYFITMNMIRESLAISIFILFIPYLMKKDCKSFIIFLVGMLVAVTMHPTALVYIAIYFLFNFVKINRKKVIIFTILNAVFAKYIVKIILQILVNVSYFNTYFAWYLKSDYNTGEFNLFSFLIIFSILILLIIAYNYAKNDKKYKLLLWLTTIATNILLYSPYLPLMQRTSWLFSLPIFVLIPTVFKYLDEKDKKKSDIVKFLMLGGYTLYMICAIFVMGYHDVVPYESVFYKVN